MSLPAGAKLGHYEILEPIGSGGMGVVYKARDTRLDRIVAIKMANERFSDRFEREARSIAAFNHPHICQLYDVGANYLVMEFIEGAPLTGPLNLEKALEYACQVLDALDAAHRKRIVHRDLRSGVHAHPEDHSREHHRRHLAWYSTRCSPASRRSQPTAAPA